MYRHEIIQLATFKNAHFKLAQTWEVIPEEVPQILSQVLIFNDQLCHFCVLKFFGVLVRLLLS